MATERPLREITAQCVSILVAYHNGERTRRTTDQMVVEVQATAAEVLELDLRPGETDERILGPVEAEILARYGPEAGSRINAEFLKAFEGVTSGDRVGDLSRGSL